MANIKSGLSAFGAVSALVIALVLPRLEAFEALKTKAYLDPVGIPTVCVGETSGVKLGDTYSVAECREMLESRVTAFDKELGGCIHGVFPPEVRAAVLSWAYNVGSPAACKSSLVAELNKGNLTKACRKLLDWKYATDRKGRRVILPGLVKRRQFEHDLCMKGVTK